MMNCEMCEISYLDGISNFNKNDTKVIGLLQKHGIILSSLLCDNCGIKSKLDVSSRFRFSCGKQMGLVLQDGKRRKKQRCTFSRSIFKNTWLENAHIRPWKSLLFINVFLTKHFSQQYCQTQLHMSAQTIVEWKSKCSEICEYWVQQRPPIGGDDVIVEVGLCELKFGKTQYNRSQHIERIWVFAGIERVSKNCFIIPVVDKSGYTLIPIILNFVFLNSIIISDESEAYASLTKIGYEHLTINHSRSFIDASEGIHMQNVERLLKDVKSCILRGGNKLEHCTKYLARYLFINSIPVHERLHYFLKSVSELYPPSHQNKINVGSS